MAVAAADDAVIGRTVGNYRVARLLGAGGMGSVYLLAHVRLPNTFAALKVLKSPRGAHAAAIKERFVQEALVAAAIGGERVARPLDLGRFDDDTPYIIMEFVEGQTLAAALEATPALPIVTALKIGWRIAETIAIAHARNIVHRDLKPSNIMLVGRREDARIKVLDFGVARADGEYKLAQTLESAVIGSPGYMSPEAASGSTVDGRTDVFSLGCTLFKMLTGDLPFPATRAREGLVALLTQPAPAPSQKRPASLDKLPPSIDALMARALAKDPTERATMAELRDGMLEILQQLAPAQAAALSAESAAPPSTTVPAEIDQLGSTIAPDASPDLEKLRAQVEQFAATRVPSSVPPPTAPTRLLAVVAVVIVVAGAASAALLRMQSRGRGKQTIAASTAPADGTSSSPPLEPARARQRQITFSGAAAVSSISPDGRTFAYVDNGHVYLHDVVNDERRDVGNGAQVSRLRWSRDSRTLYASQGLKLFEVARDGSGTLAPSQLTSGYMAFSPDGKQVANCFQPSRFIEVHDVATGALIRHIDLRGKFTFIHGLEWSPRGDWLLLITSQGAQQTLWLVSPDGKTERAVVTDGIDDAQFDGRGTAVLYLHDVGERDELKRVPLGSDGTVGAARLVLSDLDTAAFSLTADGRQLVYTRSDPHSNLWLVRGHGAAPRALTNDTAPKGAGSISPDGRQVVFTVDDGASDDVYTIAVAGGARQRLTRGEHAASPVWSPDGSSIAYRRIPGSVLVVIDARSGAEKAHYALTNAGAQLDIAWAPGKRILFHPEDNRALRALDPATRQVVPIADDARGWMFSPAYASDGDRVAVFWNAKRTPGAYLIDPIAGSDRLLLAGRVWPLGWSSDGGSVLLKPELGEVADHFDLQQLPLHGGAPRPWMTIPFNPNRTACRADGTHGFAVCIVITDRADVMLVENFDELVRAAR